MVRLLGQANNPGTRKGLLDRAILIGFTPGLLSLFSALYPMFGLLLDTARVGMITLLVRENTVLGTE